MTSFTENTTNLLTHYTEPTETERTKYINLITRALQYADRGDPEALRDALTLCEELERIGVCYVDNTEVFEPDSFAAAHDIIKQIRHSAINLIVSGNASDDTIDTYRAVLKFDAPYDFDSAIIFAEFNRPFDKKFYEPRRKQLLPVVNALQDLTDDKLDILCVSEPPGIGKTTLAIMYLVWIGLRDPNLTVLGGSHSNGFLRGVYDELLRMLEPDGEYLWREIFPTVKLVGTNAKDMRIDLGKRKRFQTFELSSIGSGNAGKVRASNLLYCDDLIPDIETAMSRDRLEKIYQQYYTDLRQRKIGKAKELHIATRWSVNDVIGRLEQQFGDSDRARFIRFAAMDENDESNFDYPFNLGFSTEFYRQQREIMDDASWRALYMNEPIERLGTLYPPEELRRYFTLPDIEPDNILAICDTKEQGTDFCVMPVIYQYGQDYYVDKFICDNGAVEILIEKVARLLTERAVRNCRIESNRGGTLFAQDVQKRLRELGGITNVTTKWTQTNKQTRIEINSGWVKAHCLFKDESLYPTDKEYRTAMNQMTTYTVAGKNKNDDVCDVLAMLVDYVLSFASNTVQLIKRPF